MKGENNMKSFEYNEFEKYRVKQDKLYKSDFDLLMEETENKDNNKKV